MSHDKNASHPYRNLEIVLATRHSKDNALSDLFRDRFGITLVVPADLDTDLLGTFSGETPRPGPLKDVLREKARLGMKKTGMKLGLASEGSFGPDPLFPARACDHEALLLVDDDRNIEIFVDHLSFQTNFGHLETRDWKEVEAFAKAVEFGTHGLIVRPANEKIDSSTMSKGVTDTARLRADFDRITSSGHSVWLETDMRAHMNPTRMKAIRSVGEKLMARLESLCPSCSTPGFGLTRVLRGLPCEACDTPTDLPYKEIWSCPSCPQVEYRRREDGLEKASPDHCPECNP